MAWEIGVLAGLASAGVDLRVDVGLGTSAGAFVGPRWQRAPDLSSSTPTSKNPLTTNPRSRSPGCASRRGRGRSSEAFRRWRSLRLCPPAGAGVAIGRDTSATCPGRLGLGPGDDHGLCPVRGHRRVDAPTGDEHPPRAGHGVRLSDRRSPHRHRREVGAPVILD